MGVGNWWPWAAEPWPVGKKQQLTRPIPQPRCQLNDQSA